MQNFGQNGLFSLVIYRNWTHPLSSFNLENEPYPVLYFVILCRPLLIKSCLFLCHTMSHDLIHCDSPYDSRFEKKGISEWNSDGTRVRLMKIPCQPPLIREGPFINFFGHFGPKIDKKRLCTKKIQNRRKVCRLNRVC